jgi:hypothetical protein
MNVDLNPDQLRVYVNLRSRIGHLRQSDMAGWSPAELALAESWYHAGGDIKSPDVPHFIATAHAAAVAANDKGRKAEVASAVRALLSASRAMDAARDAYAEASRRLLDADPSARKTKIFCEGYFVSFNGLSFDVKEARTV